MAQKSRELSQFGSFLEVDNTNKNIGITTTSSSPYVGIGTTNPTTKLHVIGDTNISGVVSATGYYLNGNQLVSAVLQTWDINGSNIYRSSGNVGIGSSIPGSKLTVSGDISATGTITGSNISASGITISSGIITASQFVSTVASGTSPLTVTSTTLVTNLNADYLRGKTPPSGDIVGDTDTQTLTNKTLTSSYIITPTVSSAGIAFSGSTSGSTTLRASTVATGIATLPAITGSDTLVARNTTETLTNKTIAAGSNTITGLTNSNLSGTAGITNANLANSTISGVSLGSTLANLSAGSFVSYSSGTTYNGSTAITVSVAATSGNTANSIISRNASGDFTAGTITCSSVDATLSGYRINGTTVIDSSKNLINVVNGSFSGIITCSSLNSTSDISLKENIQTINNALDAVSSLRGVTFDWKENGSPSIGVIAQELERVLPELVNQGEYKSVNYNGIIGVLIEAVKELSVEVEQLKSKIK
jgi:Chaperone of endosialidase